MLEYMSLFLSVCSLIFSIVIYIKHGKKLNSQQTEINEIKLNNLHEQEILKKKAKIDIQVRNLQSEGVRQIILINTGQSTASNVRVSIKDTTLVDKIQESYTIAPNDKVYIRYMRFLNDKSEGVIEIFFDDDSRKDNYITKELNNCFIV